MSRRYKITISYDGSAFSGFQEQPGRVTVQSALESALATVLGEPVRVVPSGRTDAGVHALAQTCHLTIEGEKAILRAERDDFLPKMNGVLPDAIVLLAHRRAERFHARNDVEKKTYEYVILVSRLKNPFLEDKVWRMALPLDIDAMERAARTLVGRHDFSAFCASDSTAGDKTREIFSIRLAKTSPAPLFTRRGEKFVRLAFTGSGFLKQMVRNIVGTLVDVGIGKTSAEDVNRILKSRDRRQAGRTAPARGLYLREVKYRAGSNWRRVAR